MLRNTLFATAAAAALFAVPASLSAQDGIGGDLSANVALTNVYVFRGIDQTNEKAAIQGGFDYAHDSGIYLGAWGSNVDFGDGDDATMELDLYGGYSGSFGDVGYDVGVIYYAYPNSDAEYEFFELYGSVSGEFEAVGLSAGLAWSPDYFAESGDSLYANAGISYGITDNFGVDAGLGYQWIDETDVFGTPDYLDWTIGATYSWDNFAIDGRYTDTDLDDDDCFGGSDLCSERFILSLSASF